MRRFNVLMLCTTVVLIFMVGHSALADQSKKVPMAKLCSNCHEPEPGVMMGFMENIALKSKTIQMNFLSHKEVVKFNDNTAIKNVASFEDIRKYKGKGFTIHFVEKNGEKVATEVIRFDILKTITPEEKLTKAEFKEQRQQKNAVVYDVRPPFKYKEAHIPGAKPLPAPAFNKFKDKLPKDKTTPLLLYGVGGCLSPTTAMNLKGLGYENVRIYFGGFPDWSKTDFSVTTPDWLKKAIKEEIPHVLVDLRNESAVVAGHIPGAVSVPLASLDASSSKFPVQKNAPIIFYGNGQEEAAGKALSWGYTNVRILPMSFEKWQAAGNPVNKGNAKTVIAYVPKAKPGTISIEDFEKLAAKPVKDTIIVDVRNPEELEEGKVKSSVNIPVDEMAQRMQEIPADKTPVLYCPSGIRAEMAHNILKEAGRDSRYLDAVITFDEEGNFELEEK